MSRLSDGKVTFGPWLPDLPSHENPGLAYAHGVYWANGAYRLKNYFVGVHTVTSALASRPMGAVMATSGSTRYIYVGAATKLYVNNGANWSDKSGAVYTTAATGFWRFATYGSLLMATNLADVPQSITIGAGGNFANLALVGTAPKARVIGVIGQHTVLGNLDVGGTPMPYSVQWSRIGDPTEWPTIGTADALAKESGRQTLRAELGEVTGIFGNDQFGIVIQERGVTRMTYVGGDLGYQFDEIDEAHGSIFVNGMVQKSDSVYFLSPQGWMATDGVKVVNLGAGKYSATMAAECYNGATTGTYKGRFYAAYDTTDDLIYFSVPTQGSGLQQKLYIYSVAENRMTTSTESIETLFSVLEQGGSFNEFPGQPNILAFDSSYVLRNNNGFAPSVSYTVRIGTGLAELTPGGYTRISGVKPVHDVFGTASVSLRTTTTSLASVTSSSPVTPTSRTGFADFRSEARYVAADVSFDPTAIALGSISGIEYQAVPSGAT